MRILLVADGRSPNTLHWLSALLTLGHQVRLISSYPCSRPAGVRDFDVVPLAFGQVVGSGTAFSQAKPSGFNPSTWLRRLVSQARPIFLAARYIVGPYTIQRQAERFVRLVAANPPDLVHALRIPYEGMLATATPAGIPFVVSIWGNDLTLHAKGSPWMRSMTTRCLARSDALIADANRDIRLGHAWGFAADRPTLVVPGSGGIDLTEINRPRPFTTGSVTGYLPAGVPLIVNSRGSRPGSVRNDVFFRAIPRVLRAHPEAIFLCPSLAGQPEAQRWIKRLAIKDHVRLMPLIPQDQLWDIFQHTQIFVSPSQHDGTPKSMLEAMACGCFPIVGDIESLREWITPGVNGLLVDPTSPAALADAIITALDSPELRYRARVINTALIKERAEAGSIRQAIDQFYRLVLASTQQTA
jgi:hypothetical protein